MFRKPKEEDNYSDSYAKKEEEESRVHTQRTLSQIIDPPLKKGKQLYDSKE